jgi:hypothetical protein
MAEFSRRSCAPDRGGAGCARREDGLTIRELSSLRRPTEQQIERLSRGHVAVGVSGRRLLEPAGLRRSSRLTSRNPGEPVNNRPFTLLLGSTSCGNRPVRRATSTVLNPFAAASKELGAVIRESIADSRAILRIRGLAESGLTRRGSCAGARQPSADRGASPQRSDRL